jgi:hypothetical protein
MALLKIIQDQFKTCQKMVCPTPRTICHHGRLASLADCAAVAVVVGGADSCPPTDLPPAAGGAAGGCTYPNKVCLVATMALCKMIQDQFQTCQNMVCPTPRTICHHGRLSSLLIPGTFHVGGGGANSCPTTVPTTISATLWLLLLLLLLPVAPVSCGD